MLTNIKKTEIFALWLLIISFLFINISPITVNAAIYDISSKVEQHKVQNEIKNYKTDETEHFIFKYTANDEKILKFIERNAEESYTNLSDEFQIKSNEKLTFIIFPDGQTMNETLGLPMDQKSMGIYYAGFISILSPKEWMGDGSGPNYELEFKRNGPVLHELTHYFVDKRTKGNFPSWFTEGVALYFEKKVDGYEWGEGVKYNMKPYTLYQLTNEFNNLDIDFAYRRSYEIINDFVNKNGENGLFELMDKLKEGYSIEYFIK